MFRPIILLLWALLGTASTAWSEGFAPPKPDNRNYVVNDASINQVGRTLGFVISQTVTLNTIALEHPKLASSAEARRVAFDASFGFPELRAKWFLEYAVGKEKADNFATDIERQAREAVQNVPKANAETFLAEMDARVEGRLDETVLKGMLWLQNGTQPSIEIRYWRQKFSSANHPKAAGLDIILSAPLSWDHQEGDRPHIVGKWTSQNGTGDMVVTLLVREFPGEFSFEDVLAVEKEHDWDWLVADGFEFLGGRAIELDRQPGLQVDTIGQRRTIDMVLTQQVRLYTIFPKNRMVQLSCMLGSKQDADREFYRHRFEDVKELCRQIALSVAFANTYR